MSRFIEIIFEFIGWLRIVASPLFVGLSIGAIVYLCKTDKTGMIIAIIIASSGLIIGIIWATRVWIKTGTWRYLSRMMETKDLNALKDKNPNE